MPTGGWLADVADWLDTLGLGTWDATGTTGDIYLGHMPQGTSQCWGVFYGPSGESDSGLQYDDVRFQLRYRGTADPRTSADKVQAAYDAMHGVGKTTLPGGTIVTDVLAIQSAPVALGPDGHGNHEHTLNFRADVVNTTRSSPRD